MRKVWLFSLTVILISLLCWGGIAAETSGPAPLYTVRMVSEHTEAIRANPYVFPTLSGNKDLVVGQSAGWSGTPHIPKHNLYGYLITDPEVKGEKQRIIISSGNHNDEHTGSWALQGMVDFLISDDEVAQSLRGLAEFYVYPMVNPDGRYTLKGRGNPELSAAKISDSNRAWHTSGSSSTIDAFVNAMKKDTGGSADFFLDFHSNNRDYDFFFAANNIMNSSYAQAVTARAPGIGPLSGGTSAGMMRVWIASSSGLNVPYSYCPELSRKRSIAECFAIGEVFAVAFHDLFTGNLPAPVEQSVVETVAPPQPTVAWLFEGDEQSTFSSGLNGVAQDVVWSDNTRFDYEGNQSAVFNGKTSYIDFGSPKELDTKTITVAMWVKLDNLSSGFQYMASRWNLSDDRAWHLVLNGSQIQAAVSPDGLFNDKKSYRSRTSPEINTWVHMAFTFEEGDLSLYYNGMELTGAALHLYDDDPVPQLHIPKNAPLLLGRQSRTDTSRQFTGAIDELAIWNYALSPAELAWLANNSVREID